jgi:hypothetical protein
MWWTWIPGVVGIILWVVIPITIETLAERRQEDDEMTTENFSEIMSMRADGFCESCGYGIDRCLKDGKAFCLKKDNEKEVDDEKSV